MLKMRAIYIFLIAGAYLCTTPPVAVAAARTQSTAKNNDLNKAITNARNSCSGISDAMDELKRMAGINTAITGVGTAAGIGATTAGLIKANKDKTIEQIEKDIETELEKLRAIQFNQKQDQIESNPSTQSVVASIGQASGGASYTASGGDAVLKSDKLTELEQQRDELTQKSKNLGNLRTGLVAGTTVTNAAGAVMASQNKVDESLESKINRCKSDIGKLKTALSKADDISIAQRSQLQTAINECSRWNNVDLSPINNRATGATVSSATSATLGLGATIFSAVANSNKTRDDNSDAGRDREKKLNKTANALTIGSTATSLTATVFNATQISAIKKAADVADKCQEALR